MHAQLQYLRLILRRKIRFKLIQNTAHLNTPNFRGIGTN